MLRFLWGFLLLCCFLFLRFLLFLRDRIVRVLLIFVGSCRLFFRQNRFLRIACTRLLCRCRVIFQILCVRLVFFLLRCCRLCISFCPPSKISCYYEVVVVLGYEYDFDACHVRVPFVCVLFFPFHSVQYCLFNFCS